jgi:hypothetical protein
MLTTFKGTRTSQLKLKGTVLQFFVKLKANTVVMDLGQISLELAVLLVF